MTDHPLAEDLLDGWLESPDTGPAIRVIESPHRNRSRAAAETDVLVMHCTAGWGEADAVGALFASKTRNASAHLTLGRAGEARQHVRLDHTAWHAGGGWLPSSVTLEQALEREGPIGYRPGEDHGLLLPASRSREGLNARSVGIELCNRGFVKEDEARRKGWPGGDRIRHPLRHRNPLARSTFWESYPVEQLTALERLVAHLVDAVPTLRWVTSHEDVFAIQLGNTWKKCKGKSGCAGSGRRAGAPCPRCKGKGKINVGSKLDPGPAFPWDELDLAGLQRVHFDFAAGGWRVGA